MHRYTVGLIRVIKHSDPEKAGLHGRQIMRMFPNMMVETKCIPRQEKGIYDPASKEEAIPKIIDLAKTFLGIDALIISCAEDPAVEQLQRLLPIPVIGAGSSTAIMARRFGQRAGVLGITDDVPLPYSKVFGNGLIHLGRPVGVHNTLELITSAGTHAVESLALQLKEAGACSIALACTGISTIGIAKRLAERTGLPVVDPVVAEGFMAYYECLNK